MKNPLEDLQNRMVPSAQNIADARLALADSSFDMAITAIMFPGKEYGVWFDGTEVETLDIVFGCNNDNSYRTVTNDVVIAAAKALGERPGTVGFVVHRMYEGEVLSAVFEEILSPLELMAFDTKAGAL